MLPLLLIQDAGIVAQDVDCSKGFCSFLKGSWESLQESLNFARVTLQLCWPFPPTFIWNKQAQFSCCWIQILLCFSPLPCTQFFQTSLTLFYSPFSLNVDFQPQSNATCMTQDKMSPNFGNFLSSGEHLPPGTHTTKSQRVWSVSCVSTVVYFRMSRWPIYFSISSCFPPFRYLHHSQCFSRFVCFTFELLIRFNIAAQEQGSVCSILFIQVFN